MTGNHPSTPKDLESNGGASDRLNSWKEIAAYLGKGVRTVQRWEAQMGLPVRRLGREGGEIVYALKSELDGWMANGGRLRTSSESSEAPQAPPVAALDKESPNPPTPDEFVSRPMEGVRGLRFRIPRFAWAMAVVLGAGGLAMSLAKGTGAGTPSTAIRPSRSGANTSQGGVPNPVGAVFEAGALRAWASDGTSLWTARLEAASGAHLDTRTAINPAREHRRIAVQDLDGDGTNEVLIIAPSPSGSGDGLRVFNADGSLRFTHVAGRPVTFGKEIYHGFNTHALYLLQNGDGSTSLWVATANVPWFPGILQQISSEGQVLSEYWSNGVIMTVRPVTLKGREILMVGAYDNERHGASLAFLDRLHASGSAPAENPKYRCLDCAKGDPLEFLVFPPGDLLNEMTAGQGCASVVDATLTGQAELVVTVHQVGANVPGETAPLDGTLNYTLSTDTLQLERFLPGWTYLSIHKAWERAGRMDHPYGSKDEADLANIVRWRGGRFVPLNQAHGSRVLARAPRAPFLSRSTP